MQHCKTCKHFAEAGEYQNWKRFGLGTCARVVLFWNATEWRDCDDDEDGRVLKEEYKNELAFTQDASDYKAFLLVSPEFGCVQHEPK